MDFHYELAIVIEFILPTDSFLQHIANSLEFGTGHIERLWRRFKCNPVPTPFCESINERMRRFRARLATILVFICLLICFITLFVVEISQPSFNVPLGNDIHDLIVFFPLANSLVQRSLSTCNGFLIGIADDY